jgi:hypothetical protein
MQPSYLTCMTQRSGAEVAIKSEKGACDLCHEPWEDPVSAECGHNFCRACILDYIGTVAATPGNGNNNTSGEGATPNTNTKRANSRGQAVATPVRRDTSTSSLAATACSEGVRCPDCDCPLTLQLDAPSTGSASRTVSRVSRNVSSSSLAGTVPLQICNASVAFVCSEYMTAVV